MFFGGYHAGKYVENPDTTLTAIFDPDAERAQALAGQHDATPYSDLDAFLQAVDVVTIASPGVTHAEMGARALMAGKPVLIEKPLAVTVNRQTVWSRWRLNTIWSWPAGTRNAWSLT